jgi:Protein of unknown function (DUF1997)
MYVRFNASESLEIIVEAEISNLQHYLRQPQRLVKAIANPQLMEQLSSERFRLKMRPLNFMEIYHFQPMVVLQVTTDSDGTVILSSQECEIRGLEYIDRRFSLNLQGRLAPANINGTTYLRGKADLEVKVELPPPLWLTPKPLLEIAGNGLLKSVLLRIKQHLLSQLLDDYYQWVASNSSGRTDSVQFAIDL